MVFLIGKASPARSRDRDEASQRIAWMADHLRQAGLIESCSDVHVGYVGQAAAAIDVWNAKASGYLTELDEREIPDDDVDAYINRSVAVIVFPCRKQLCSFAKDEMDYSCEVDAPKRLFDECQDLVCGS